MSAPPPESPERDSARSASNGSGSSGSGSSRPGRSRRGAETAQRILDAAEALFAERGYAGTTLRDVAERVDLRIPSLYNHFESKESLYQAVLERGVAPVMTALSEALEAGPSMLERPDRLIEETMTALVDRPMLPRLILHETLSGGQHLTPMLRDIMQPVFGHAQTLLELTPHRTQRWSEDEGRLLVLALYHVMLGYIATAPLYEDLTGIDLRTDESVSRQTRFVSRMAQILFGPGTGGDESEGG